jgi:hypothetical protein
MTTTENSARPGSPGSAPSPSHTRSSSSAIASRTNTISQVTAPLIVRIRCATYSFETAGTPLKYASTSLGGLSTLSSCAASYS